MAQSEIKKKFKIFGKEILEKRVHKFKTKNIWPDIPGFQGVRDSQSRIDLSSSFCKPADILYHYQNISASSIELSYNANELISR